MLSLHLPIDMQYGRNNLAIEGVRVTVGERVILDVPELVVPFGQHLGIAGVSGSGKTTLLHVIAGLRTPTVGRVG
jgi:ABC-type transporter Mla maintaining outer membrane lipid asymmetry ATPase subunit MlaF